MIGIHAYTVNTLMGMRHRLRRLRVSPYINSADFSAGQETWRVKCFYDRVNTPLEKLYRHQL